MDLTNISNKKLIYLGQLIFQELARRETTSTRNSNTTGPKSPLHYTRKLDMSLDEILAHQGKKDTLIKDTCDYDHEDDEGNPISPPKLSSSKEELDSELEEYWKSDPRHNS